MPGAAHHPRVAAAVGGLAVELEPIDVRGQEGERLLQLGAREVGAQAVVNAGAEGGQPRALRARDVEALRIDDAVAVGADARDEDHRALRERDAADLHVLEHDARGERRDRLEAQRLLDGARSERGIGAERRPLVGVLGE
jgi:hypothetical protein